MPAFVPDEKSGVCKIKLPSSVSGRPVEGVFIYVHLEGASQDARNSFSYCKRSRSCRRASGLQLFSPISFLQLLTCNGLQRGPHISAQLASILSNSAKVEPGLIGVAGKDSRFGNPHVPGNS